MLGGRHAHRVEPRHHRVTDQRYGRRLFRHLRQRVDDRGIQTLLREVSTENLVMALKGTDDGIQTKIFSNMSQRAADMLKDDLEAKGPVKLSEVEAAQKEILAIARRLTDEGQMSLGGAGGEEMI